MKKRIISLFAVVMLLFTAIAFADGPVSVTITAGQVVSSKAEIAVSISGNPAVNYGYIEVEFDPQKLTASALTKSAVLDQNASLMQSSGKIRCFFQTAENANINGVLFTATMTLAATNFTETTLSVSEVVLQSKGEVSVNASANSAKIAPPAPQTIDTFTFDGQTVSYDGDPH